MDSLFLNRIPAVSVQLRDILDSNICLAKVFIKSWATVSKQNIQVLIRLSETCNVMLRPTTKSVTWVCSLKV
jgi:hypothetical protein